MKTGALTDIFQAAVRAADPYHAIMKYVHLQGERLVVGNSDYDMRRFRRIIVVGAGKGAAPMTKAVEELFGQRIDQGIVIVKYGHSGLSGKIVQIEASHPLPDDAGVNGTEEIIKMLQQATDDTLVVCLLSGGASSLLVAPAEGITLKEKRIATEILLRAGADIYELNTVRKHLSKIKGGRLAETGYPATIISLILSDVIGDRLDVIASGPTVPDSTTWKDAVAVVKKYSLEHTLPAGVMKRLEQGCLGKIADTPKDGEAFFATTRNIIIGSLQQSLNAAREKAAETGFEPKIITSELQGEARIAGQYLASAALDMRSSLRPENKPACLISGGETIVRVKGTGIGGRNQELALAFAAEIAGVPCIALLSAGTDGTDGPTDAAGAVVDGETAPKARDLGMDPFSYLENNDSYSFFRKLDSLTGEQHQFITGPTGTNVMDVQIMIVEGQAARSSDAHPACGSRG